MKNCFRHPKIFNMFSRRTENLKMLFSLALIMNGINLILKAKTLVLKVYFVTLHEILLGLLQQKSTTLKIALLD